MAAWLIAGCVVDAGNGGTSSATSEGDEGQETSEGDGGSGDGIELEVIPCAELVAPDDTRCIEGGTFVDIGSGPREPHAIQTFFMDTTEVSVAAYQKCVDAGVCFTPDDDASMCHFGVAEFEQYPVNCVNAYDAAGYCAWLGRRLPTEWEWEWAARSRVHARPYPWGRHPWAMTGCWGRWGACEVGVSGEGGAVTVDGLLDIPGNVWEWTASPWEFGAGMRVLRGGAWNSHPYGTPSPLHVGFRFGRETVERGITYGFRCVEDPE